MLTAGIIRGRYRCLSAVACLFRISSQQTILHHSSPFRSLAFRPRPFSQQPHLLCRCLHWGTTRMDSEAGVVAEPASGEDYNSDEETDPIKIASPSIPTPSGDAGDSAPSGGGEFSYISKGFTSEIFKIELANIPQNMGYKNIRKYLTSLNLNPKKIKRPNERAARGLAFVTFCSEEERATAISVLNGRQWKKKTLIAKIAKPTPNPLQRKRSPVHDLKIEAKRAKLESMSLEERLNSVVTPWLDVPYPEQLRRKEEELKSTLKKIVSAITNKTAHPGQWFNDVVKKNSGLPCSLEPFRTADAGTEGQKYYRNKCEFTIGSCSESGKVVVGFRLGSYEEGIFDVISARTCHHIPDRMKQLAQVFEDYLNQSELPPYSARTEEGYWRMLTLRCYDSGESMAIIQMHPQQLSQEAIEQEEEKIQDFFVSGSGAEAPPTSLYFQPMARLEANVEPIFHHLLGQEHVYENLLDLKFRISPTAFFQVNTPATKVLYSLIKELLSSDDTNKDAECPVIYDICCGTGTIGLYLAKALAARKVVGVEMVKQAVEDAKFNAKINGFENVAFVCGKAEDVMSGIELPWSKHGGIIGVVDPPRAGLHPKVVSTIRKCAPLQKLVYVSCNPKGLKSNLLDFCRRKTHRMKGNPFRVVSATPVDMFPHTPHCELVLLLERVQEEEGGGRDGKVGVSPEINLESVQKLGDIEEREMQVEGCESEFVINEEMEGEESVVREEGLKTENHSKRDVSRLDEEGVFVRTEPGEESFDKLAEEILKNLQERNESMAEEDNK